MSSEHSFCTSSVRHNNAAQEKLRNDGTEYDYKINTHTHTGCAATGTHTQGGNESSVSRNNVPSEVNIVCSLHKLFKGM